MHFTQGPGTKRVHNPLARVNATRTGQSQSNRRHNNCRVPPIFQTYDILSDLPETRNKTVTTIYIGGCDNFGNRRLLCVRASHASGRGGMTGIASRRFGFGQGVYESFDVEITGESVTDPAFLMDARA